MPFCPYCGSQLVENAKFCGSCGARVQQSESYGAAEYNNEQWRIENEQREREAARKYLENQNSLS